jgi:O-antigen ligase
MRPRSRHGHKRQHGSTTTESTFPFRRITPFGWASAGLLVACLLLGGASRQNDVQVFTLEVLALPVAIWAIWRLYRGPRPRKLVIPLIVCALIIAIPIAQLAPLPFQYWSNLAGRDGVAEYLIAVGIQPDTLAYSLTPSATRAHALALLPPFTVLAATITLSAAERRAISVILMVIVVGSLLLGGLQISGGSGSAFYLYEETNRESAVGFFSNRNHQATLLLMSVPFAAMLVSSRRADFARSGLVWAAAGVAAVGLVIVGLGIIRSRAGLILIAPTLGATILATWLVLREGRTLGKTMLGLAITATAAIAAVAFYALEPILERFDVGIGSDLRFVYAPIVFSAGQEFAPFGSGIGSFVEVFQAREPLEIVANRFVNHAHNDYLELWLETGWLMLAPLGLFIFWWVVASWRNWLSRYRGSAENLAVAASIAIGVVLIYSTVDYPMRTLAIASLFAFCCGILICGAQPGEGANQRREASTNSSDA